MANQYQRFSQWVSSSNAAMPVILIVLTYFVWGDLRHSFPEKDTFLGTASIMLILISLHLAAQQIRKRIPADFLESMRSSSEGRKYSRMMAWSFLLQILVLAFVAWHVMIFFKIVQ